MAAALVEVKKDAAQIAALEQVAQRAEQARHEVERAVRIARSAGWSLRDIAKAAGMSHEQVRRIVAAG